ncbi:hypothetical protein VP01_1425g2 [Puccinia sorghi]|uniref:DUF7872 domain-containing protein n=1 Tax=Puccinia sorghi TaxID=27349 RepID=A0A0L6VL34_9BASI|nr:hypothetical protein VP01_1425g2 [Puccinia sorghi]
MTSLNGSVLPGPTHCYPVPSAHQQSNRATGVRETGSVRTTPTVHQHHIPTLAVKLLPIPFALAFITMTYTCFQNLLIYLVHASLCLEQFGASARTTAITPGGSGTPQIQFKGQYPPNNPSCQPLPVTRETWNQLKLNDHLKNYPGGDKMSLVSNLLLSSIFLQTQEYATKLNMTNFVCGIGGACNSGQPCYPLETVDWYILFAVQQWNSYMNIYYEAVGYGIAIVQSSLNALIASLFPATDTTAVQNFKSNLGIQASLSQVTGTVVMDVMLAFGSTTGGIWAFFDILNFVLTAVQGAAAFAIQEPPAPLQDGFYQASCVLIFPTTHSAHLSSLLFSADPHVIHKHLAEEGKQRISAGISTDQGIFGVVKDGFFLDPASFPLLPDIEEQIRNITLALGVNMMLHSIELIFFFFFFKKKERIHNRGIRRTHHHYLPYFTPFGAYSPAMTKGRMVPGQKEHAFRGATNQTERKKMIEMASLMHNIVIAKDDKTHNDINNANVIYDYFGISTELIVTSSIKCQNFNKGWNYVPWAQDKGALPKAADSDCVFNLPVCYTQDENIHKKIHKKKWTTARACRHSGLPLDK